MKKNAGLVSFIFIISTVIQLGSQIVVTRLFGASTTLENFLAAVALPTILVTIIYGTINDLYLPIYGGEKKKNSVEADKKLLTAALGFTVVTTIFSVLLALLSPQVLPFLFARNVDLNLPEIVREFSFMMLTLPLSVLVTFFGIRFYSAGNFRRFPLAQACGSLFNLALIVLLYRFLGIWALVVAFVLTILLQIPFVWPKIKLELTTIKLSPLLLAWVPIVLANLALRSDTVIIRSLGSTLGPGYLVYLNLVAKMFSLSAGLVTIGLQIILLPKLVGLFSEENFQTADQLVGKTKLAAIILSLVSAAGVYFLAPYLLQILFLGGKFTLADINVTIGLLPAFFVPAVGWGIVGVFFQPLLARKRLVPLGVISIISLLTAWVIGNFAVEAGLGVSAITLSLSILLFGCVVGSELVWQFERRK